LVVGIPKKIIHSSLIKHHAPSTTCNPSQHLELSRRGMLNELLSIKFAFSVGIQPQEIEQLRCQSQLALFSCARSLRQPRSVLSSLYIAPKFIHTQTRWHSISDSVAAASQLLLLPEDVSSLALLKGITHFPLPHYSELNEITVHYPHTPSTHKTQFKSCFYSPVPL
jgi:hypothetical protein